MINMDGSFAINFSVWLNNDLTMKIEFCQKQYGYFLPLLLLAKLVETSCLTGWFIGMKHIIRWLFFKRRAPPCGGQEQTHARCLKPQLKNDCAQQQNFPGQTNNADFMLPISFVLKLEGWIQRPARATTLSPNRKETLLPPLLPNAASHPVSAPVAALRPYNCVAHSRKISELE